MRLRCLIRLASRLFRLWLRVKNVAAAGKFCRMLERISMLAHVRVVMVRLFDVKVLSGTAAMRVQSAGVGPLLTLIKRYR